MMKASRRAPKLFRLRYVPSAGRLGRIARELPLLYAETC